MTRKHLLPGLGASIGMLILILDGKTALEGAQAGIELCLKTVIPSLLPFFVLSILLTGSLSGASLPFLRPLGQLCRIPEGAESILFSGFLGGYPVGAQCISAAYHGAQLQKQDAERMLSFCNNAGPAFLFGMVASMFPSRWFAWALWGIHIGSALLTAIVIPGKCAKSSPILNKAETSIPDALQGSIRVMASVCGWVILFRVAIAFLKRWIIWLFPAEMQVGIIGLLELSNGCCELVSVADTAKRFVICSCILAFGGFCVSMQTISVTKGLSLRYYYLGKSMQTIFSLILSIAILYRSWLSCFAVLLFFLFILSKIQNKSSNRSVVGV